MALLSVIVRQAQYSGDKSITGEYCTYVTLTLDRCHTTTTTVKGHNPHWEQDYLFETQSTSRGLLMEVWRQDNYRHIPIGCYWLPLNMVRYSNEHKTGLWASLGSELCFENGLIIKSINPTGHFLLYDARLEDPDDRRGEHESCENGTMDDYYRRSAASRKTMESVSNIGTYASVSADHSDEWCKYENYHEQNGYRSSSTENMRSDLDYSYSEASNQADRRSCYESSEKNTKKDAQFNQKYQRTEYYGGSSFQQAEVYDERSEGYNRENEYEDHIGTDEQWESDEYGDNEQVDDFIYEKNHDYDADNYDYPVHHKSSHYSQDEIETSYNEDTADEDDDPEEMDGDIEDEDEEYYENDGYECVSMSSVPLPTVKRKLPSIPSLDAHVHYSKSNFLYDQYQNKNNALDAVSRVPSIFVDSPSLSPCMSIHKGTTAFDYCDQHSDDEDSSVSAYQYSDTSATVQGNQKTYRRNHNKINTIHRYPRDSNFISRIDDYMSDGAEYDDLSYSVVDDYVDYEEIDAKSDVVDRYVKVGGHDDINNNQLTNNRGGVSEFTKKLCSQFEVEESNSETYETNRRQMCHYRMAALPRQPETFDEHFEWTYNEIPEEEYEPYDVVQSLPHVLPEQEVLAFHNEIGSIVEEDDVTPVSPGNSSSLSPRSLNYIDEKDKEREDSYEKDNTPASPYHEDTIKSPASDKADRTMELAYRSPYKNSLTDVQLTLQTEKDANETEPNQYFNKLDVIAVSESRKPSLKEENLIELRRQKARDRWHTAYNKIVHQLNILQWL